MAQRQAPATAESPKSEGPGRSAQRRRTRAAILAAASRLIAGGADPSIDDIALAADVARRTVYLHFPTLDQLLLDASVGALSAQTVDAALGTDGGSGETGNAAERVDALLRSMASSAPETLPLGRKIIRLTVDAPPRAAGEQRRGYRRLEWIECAIQPLRDTLTDEQFDRLRGALALVAGWEAMVVLRDICGMQPDREEDVLRWAAQGLVTAMLSEITT